MQNSGGSGSNSLSEAMNILNEAMTRFPDAISFAAGRPPDNFIRTPDVTHWVDTLVKHRIRSNSQNTDEEAIWRVLGQYSDTNGVVLDVVSRHLEKSGIGSFKSEALMITNGAQEALLICLAGLVGHDKCVVAADPSYVGLAGPAEIFGYSMEPIPDGPDFLRHLEARLSEQDRKPVGAVYVIPDFSNPSGRVMPLHERQRLVDLAEQHRFYLIEDAAYRHFRYEGTHLPTLKSLDRTGHVLYVESFAKTVLPGLRVAVLIADQEDKTGQTLARRLSSIKSYISVATSPVNQAALAGFLLECTSLGDTIEPNRLFIKRNRDTMSTALEKHLGNFDGVSWAVPEGGFFMTVKLPFAFQEEAFLECAQKTGVIVMPMSFFSPTGRGPNEVRLAFSNTKPDHIEHGIERFARYVFDHLPGTGRAGTAKNKKGELV